MAADADITNFTAPADAVVGESVTVKADVTNTGNTGGYFWLKYYDADDDSLIYDYGRQYMLDGVTVHFPERSLTMPDKDWHIVAKAFAGTETNLRDSEERTVTLDAPPEPDADIQNFAAPDSAAVGDDVVVSASVENTGTTGAYFWLKYYDADDDSLIYEYGRQWILNGVTAHFPERSLTMPDKDWNLIAKVFIGTETTSADTEERTVTLDAPTTPTISSLSWSPAGDFHKLPSGASLTGSTEDLYLIGTDPGAFADPGFSDGEALLRIGTDGAMFAVAEGNHFRFDDMEWWVLNIVCGPECSFITLADENAEAAREPKIGDEIQFSCNVDWHGETPDEVRWYYAKTPNRCFDEGDVSWTLFANEQFPLHVFEEDDDTDIVFIKAWARNKAGEIGELGDTCEPVFNLWAYHPSWWDSLLESIRSVDETIAKPITDLFVIEGLEGWTEPPFTCPICEQVFDGTDSELEYAKHLLSHIKAFETGWFSTRFAEWATLEPQLESGSIGAQWWHLSDADRQQIATLAIANTEPNIAFAYIRTGKQNCEGGEGSWSSAQCGANAIVRYWKFGEDTPDGYNAYWSYDKIEEHCYVPEKPYNLPCFRVVAAKTDFGHEMAALQIGEDPSTLDSWRIFQYGEYNIKPGGWQMPYGCHIEISKYFGDIIAEFDI